MAEKKQPERLLWIDLEMTGLHPENQRIIEIAAIVTGFDLVEIATYEAIIHHDDPVLSGAEPWVKENMKELLQEVKNAEKQEHQVTAEFLAFIDTHFPNEKPILAGNSIHQDRRFIRKWWPTIEQRLHYRMLDVSAFKIWIQGSAGEKMTKGEKHRALWDIRDSIAELKWCLDKLANKQMSP